MNERRIPGPPGKRGPSAYEMAVAQGQFKGSFPEFLEWIKGEPSTVPGPPGKSAYDVAVELGFKGDVAAWVRSLKAAPALPGRPGPVGPMPRHEWEGTRLRFEQAPGGEWGELVDLKGEPGRPGAIVGGVSASVNSWDPSGW